MTSWSPSTALATPPGRSTAGAGQRRTAGAALDNLRDLGGPVQVSRLAGRPTTSEAAGALAALAAGKSARVVNFLTFNPYFEWERDVEISFQARHSRSPRT